METPDELDNIEFKIIKEDWNTYEFNDDTKLRARIFLVRLTETKNVTPPKDLKPNEVIGQYNISFNTNFQVFAMSHNKGKPTIPLPPANQITDQQKQEVDILTSNEPWNVYEIIKNGMVIRIKLVFSEVYKVKDVYDQFGEPYYIVKNAPIIDYKPPNRKEKFA